MKKENDCNLMRSNHGFSLVELIIVIAIMAILVGVMAPQLIKYIEKANISADTQLCDTIHSAIVITLSDPSIVTSTDSADHNWISDFTTPNGGGRLDASTFGPPWTTCAFAQNVSDIIGYDFPVDLADFRALCRSTPAKTDGILCYQVNDSGSGFIIYIAHSDNTGQKRNLNPATEDPMSETIHAPEL